MNWLQSHVANRPGASSDRATSPPHQPQPATFDQGRVLLCEKCNFLLHVAETWAMTKATLDRLRRNDRAMIRWICNGSKLRLPSLKAWTPGYRCGAPRWYGHVERSKGWMS